VNFDLSEDQQAIRDAARELLAARYPLAEVRRLAYEDGAEDAGWAEIAELGWPGIAVPEDQGGQGLGVLELAVLAEETGRALAPAALRSTWWAAGLLTAAGEAERLAGGRRGAVAIWGEVQERHGALHGEKRLVLDVPGADVLVVDGRWVVDPAAAEVEAVPALDATRPLATVRFDGTPAEPLAGDALDHAWLVNRLACAAESVGVAQRALDMAVAHAKERRQFDRPVGTFQAVSHRCAQMLLEVEGARTVVQWAGWALDHAPEEAELATHAAHAYASDCGVRVTQSALQVLGGLGFTWEHDLHLFLKRARANAHALGSAADARGRIAEQLL
jgi:alkylation response protein AidB-like acyl-CoA dehydrogenase